MPVPTHGLTHIALAVRNAERAFQFYERVFGMIAVYRQDGFIQAQTPGARDVLVFEERKDSGAGGGIMHFGFRLKDPKDRDAAAEAVVAAGGKVEKVGEFAPDEPYLFCLDPDGYEVEIWFERPTSVDPA